MFMNYPFGAPLCQGANSARRALSASPPAAATRRRKASSDGMMVEIDGDETEMFPDYIIYIYVLWMYCVYIYGNIIWCIYICIINDLIWCVYIYCMGCILLIYIYYIVNIIMCIYIYVCIYEIYPAQHERFQICHGNYSAMMSHIKRSKNPNWQTQWMELLGRSTSDHNIGTWTRTRETW